MTRPSRRRGCIGRQRHPAHACTRACARVLRARAARGCGWIRQSGGYRRSEPAQRKARRGRKRARLVARRDEGRLAQPHLGSDFLHHVVVDAPRARRLAGRDEKHRRGVAGEGPICKSVHLGTPTRSRRVYPCVRAFMSAPASPQGLSLFCTCRNRSIGGPADATVLMRPAGYSAMHLQASTFVLPALRIPRAPNCHTAACLCHGVRKTWGLMNNHFFEIALRDGCPSTAS